MNLWLLELSDVFWRLTVKTSLLLLTFTQEWFLPSFMLKHLEKLTNECFNYFLSFILPDKRQKWLLQAEWTNPSEQAALIWLQSNLHDKSWLRKHNFLSQWDNMQINLNSRFFHLTKCHRSAQENVIMSGKANGAMVFFIRGKINILLRMIQISNLKTFTNCPPRMVLKRKDQFYCNIIFRNVFIFHWVKYCYLPFSMVQTTRTKAGQLFVNYICVRWSVLGGRLS